MPFQKGHKLSGNRTGKQNKVTKALRENFKEFAEGNFDKCQEWLDRVADDDPAEAMRLYLAFTERILGKVTTSAVDITSQGKQIQAPILQLIGDPSAD